MLIDYPGQRGDR